MEWYIITAVTFNVFVSTCRFINSDKLSALSWRAAPCQLFVTVCDLVSWTELLDVLLKFSMVGCP